MGKYKIDDSTLFICDSPHNSFSCPSNRVCLGNKSPELLSAGIHIDDYSWNFQGFENYLFTLVYLVQMMTQDRWGSTFTMLIYSRFGSFLHIFVFSIPLCTSMIINGFIIASFLEEIIRIKKQDVRRVHLDFPPQRLQLDKVLQDGAAGPDQEGRSLSRRAL